MTNSDFRPAVWNPPASPGLTGGFAENDRLAEAELWDTGGRGPEDVEIDHDGGVVTGLVDGRIIRFPPQGGFPETLVGSPGRPLGIERHPQGGLVVCDADHGLFHLQDRKLRLLADSFREERFLLTNNAAVAPDGTIYFSVSSHRWPLAEYTKDLMERSGTGRLYRREPNGDLEVLVDGMVFANGVALAPDGSRVFVAETGSYRILQVWLSGDRAGRVEVLCDNLPAFPDNLSIDHQHILWCAFPRPRDRLLDALLPRPGLRRLVVRLPESLQPQPSRHGIVVGFDLEGRVLHDLQDRTGKVAVTTGARRHPDGRLFVGSLSQPAVAVLPL